MIDGMGERLHEAYKQSGLTAKEVADEAGLGINTMRAIIRGDQEPRASTIVLLCGVLGCSADWLLGIKGGD
jgi:transcriptional regulator with XRE-family HTH domain